MTVALETPSVSYATNGTTTRFDFPFHVPEDSGSAGVAVYTTNGAVVNHITSGFTLTILANRNGGYVQFTRAPAAGLTVTIRRETLITQGRSFPNGVAFHSTEVERLGDKITCITQELAEGLARAVQVPPGSTTDPGDLMASIEADVRAAEAARDRAEAARDRTEALHEATVTDPNVVAVGEDLRIHGNIVTVATNLDHVRTVSGSVEAVKTVSENMGDVLTVSGNMDAVKTVTDASGAVVTVADNIDLVSLDADRYQVAPSPPTDRYDGTPLQDGDRYFNTVAKTTYVWIDGEWQSDVGAKLGTAAARDIGTAPGSVPEVVADAAGAGVLDADLLNRSLRALDTDAAGPIRTRLTANLTVYVRANGNDNNDGLTESTALATPAAAKRLLSAIDPAGYIVVVDIGPGTFTGPGWKIPQYDYTNLYIQGAGVDATVITTNNEYDCSVSNITCQSDLSATYGTTMYVRARSKPGHILLRSSRMYCLSGLISVSSATIEYDDPAATVTEGIFASYGGVVLCGSATFIARVGMAFTYFATAGRGGAIHTHTSTFSGSATGRKYNAYQGGVISGQGANSTLEPLFGDQPGTIAADSSAGIRGAAQVVGAIAATGAISYGFGIASCTRTDVGTYTVALDRPAGNTNYAVVTSPQQIGSQGWEVVVSAKTTSSLQIQTWRNDALTNGAFSLALYW